MTHRLLFESATKLRGTPGKDYPIIDTPADVDLEALEDPYFITLPIGRVGAKSRGSGRTYTEEAVKSLVRQVNENRPEGGWGHQHPDTIGYEYTEPAIRWVAATLESDGRAWGKALVLTEQATRYYKTAVATNARVGTSVWGPPPKQNKKGEVSDFSIFRIDIADSNLAGIEDAVAVPIATREMTNGEPNVEELDPKAFVNEMTTKVTMLTQERDAALARVAELEQASPLLSEMSTLLGVEPEKFISTIKSMQQRLADVESANLKDQIAEMVAKQVKPELAAKMLAEMVSESATLEAAEARLKTLLEQDFIKQLIKENATREQGGTIVLTDGSNAKKTKGQEFEERAAEIRAKYVPATQ